MQLRLALQMNSPKHAFFTSIIYFVCLNSKYACAEDHLPKDKMGESYKNDIAKCELNRIPEIDGVESQVKGVLDLQYNVPKEMTLLAGDKFVYECCGAKEAIYRFGLYKNGSSDPDPLICRVEMKNGHCLMSWATDFNASIYSVRLSVEYNTSASCMIWTIENVTNTDEQIYVVFMRDNYAHGQRFKQCTPISLKVSIAASPSPPIPSEQATTNTEIRTTSNPSADLSTSNAEIYTTSTPSADLSTSNAEIYSTLTPTAKQSTSTAEIHSTSTPTAKQSTSNAEIHKSQPSHFNKLYGIPIAIGILFIGVAITLCIWKRRKIADKICNARQFSDDHESRCKSNDLELQGSNDKLLCT